MSKQWQQIVLQTNVATVIQGIQGKRKKSKQKSLDSAEQGHTLAQTFQSAFGHLHGVMPRTPCLSATADVKPHEAVTAARTDFSASLFLCFSFPPWSRGSLRLKGLFWISSCDPSVCQQQAVGIAVLGVNGERGDYFQVFLAHQGQIKASEDFNLSPCVAQEQESPSWDHALNSRRNCSGLS